jgi:hypothetical protein
VKVLFLGFCGGIDLEPVFNYASPDVVTGLEKMSLFCLEEKEASSLHVVTGPEKSLLFCSAP